MKNSFLYILVAVMLIAQMPIAVFAEEAPPSINFAFDDEGDTPPTLGEITTPEAESPTIPAPSPVTPPVIPATTTTPAATTNAAAAAATLATNNSSTSISQTGPETGYLIVLSLILGYISTKSFKKLLKERE
ncbi:MAG: hypothetical protein O3B47_03645 [bacterium]|nr:hypothetical protein [bacterium]